MVLKSALFYKIPCIAMDIVETSKKQKNKKLFSTFTLRHHDYTSSCNQLTRVAPLDHDQCSQAPCKATRS